MKKRGIAMDKRATFATGPAPLSMDEKLALANRLYREYRTICYWHMKPELIVTEKILPSIIDGLRIYGGRKGALEAARLLK